MAHFAAKPAEVIKGREGQYRGLRWTISGGKLPNFPRFHSNPSCRGLQKFLLVRPGTGNKSPDCQG